MSTPHTEQIDWLTLVTEAEGEEYPETEWDEYEFSKKTFKTTENRGVYSGTYPD